MSKVFADSTEKSPMAQAFESWFGFEVCPDMDIQTSVAWDHWRAAWNEASRLDPTDPVFAECDRLRDSCDWYEAALRAAFPEGASGAVFDYWNHARQLRRGEVENEHADAVFGIAIQRREIERLKCRVAELEQDLQTTADALGHAHLQLAEANENLSAAYVCGLQKQVKELEAQLAERGEPVAVVIDNGLPEGGIDWLPHNGVPLELGQLLYTSPQPVVPDGMTLVPTSALKWLHGEEGEFVQDRPGAYWWRSKFRELCAAATEVKP